MFVDPDRLLALFPGREDAHGFAPADGKFTTKRRPLLPIHAKAHLDGSCRIGRHPLLPDGTTWWAVLDLDEGGATPVLDLCGKLQQRAIPFLVERSKSKGYHIWVFFASAVPAWKARAVLKALAEEAGWPDLEIFPKQDAADDLGNFLWLPLHGESVKEGRTLFVDLSRGNWPPHEDQAALLASASKVSEAALDKIIAAKGLQPPAERKAAPASNGGGAIEAGTTTLPLPPCAAKIYAEGVTEPGRSDWAHFLARHFRRRGLPEEATVGLLLPWNEKNRPEPLPAGKVAEMVRTAYAKEYTSLGCEYLKGAKAICGDACPVKAKEGRQEQQMVDELPPAEVTRDGDDFTYRWASLGVEARLARLRDSGEGVYGEIGVSLEGRALHWGRANLASLSAREGLVTKLNRIRQKVPWREILEEVCRETAEQLRAAAPTVQLTPAPAQLERRLVDKVVLDGETNVLFADGGAGKSLFALAIGVAVATGKPLPAGLTPRRSGPVLYLDWESIEAEHQERLGGILVGLGVTAPVPIFYRRMVGALADEAPALRAEVARVGAILVIADSLGPACGAEPEGADAAIRALNALRSIAPARLVLAHVSKLHADQPGAARPFGSVYVLNLPRNVWELRKGAEDEGDTLTIGAYHRKTNRGRLLPPFGLRFEFGEHGTRLQAADLGQDAGLRARAGLRYSIVSVLRAGGRTIAELAEETEGSEEYVMKVMRGLEKAGKVVRVGDQRQAPGRPIVWGLKA